jgi:tetraacyldisaccharide 4'-kinase
MFRVGVLRSIKVSRPVIVIGNLTVGGTGKTPLVIWLANTLTAQGYRVGVITRGYGGKARHWPQRVEADSQPDMVGDEPVLIARQTQAVVFAGPDRVAAALQAIAAGAQLIISDDGLQHYRLQRDLEWVVVDASRLFGNAHLLPAGPLREPIRRLSEVNRVLVISVASNRYPSIAPIFPIVLC